MKKSLSFKRLMVLVMVLSLVMVPCSACFAKDENLTGDEWTGGRMVGDIVVVRPIGFCMTVLGSVMFVVSLPFTAPTGTTGEAFDGLMAGPAMFTFNRPLGEF